MKRLYLKCLFLGILTLFSVKASAYDCEVDGIYYDLNKDDKTASVTYQNYSNYRYSSNYIGSVTIPSSFSYNGTVYSVTGIGEHAFYGCSSLTSIAIPSSVASIGGNAFYLCSGLNKVIVTDIAAWCNISFSYGTNPLYYAHHLYSDENTEITELIIPNSVTSIREYAFEGCTDLTSVVIPSSVTSIKSSAFSGCSGLTSINIPDGVTTIEHGTFSGCRGLTSIIIPNSVTTIENRAFISCQSLTSVSIGNSVTSIGNEAFESCRSLTSIDIPNSVTTIGEEAFWDCSNLASINIGNSVSSIGRSAFNYCRKLTSVTIPYSVTTIEYNTFGSCESLTSVTIPNSVTTIGEDAFYECKSLTSINIPNSVTSIKSRAFDRCYALTSINIPNSVTSIGAHAFNGTSWIENQSDGVVYAGKVAYNYKGTMPNNTNITLKEGTIGIAGKAFFDCSSLTSIVIPNSVTNIEESAFSGCTGLTAITIPNNVTNIGQSAFGGCSNLTTVTINSNAVLSKVDSGLRSIFGYQVEKYIIGNEVTSIGKSAFSSCTGLTSIEIPNSVTNIGEYAFSECRGLTSIEIPNSVTSIGESAFSGCSGLTSIEIPNSVTTIGEFAFNGCTGLTSVTISNSVTSIGEYAFYGCSGLTSVTIPNSVTTIGEYAFYGCSGLTSMTIGNSVTSIEEWTFSECSGLTSVEISNSVTSIGEFAFMNCSGLTSVEIPNSVTSIGRYAFYGCSSLTSVTIPNSVTTIGGSAFEGCSGLTSVIIPNSVTTIEGTAFSGCSGLTSVTIGNNVTSIGYYAFGDCNSLSVVINKSTSPQRLYNDVFSSDTYTNAVLYVPQGTKESYASTYPWKQFKKIVEMDGLGYDTGNCLIDVTDEFTYYTDEAPHVENATVVVYEKDSKKEIHRGTTGEDGTLLISNLPTGDYIIHVEAENHESKDYEYHRTSNEDETVEITISYTGGVTCEFIVEETSEPDLYHLSVNYTYAVDIPLPFVSLSVPSSINVDDMAVGESVEFQATLYNKGFIRVNDVALLLPNNIPFMSFVPQQAYQGLSIEAKQSVTITVKATKTAAGDCKTALWGAAWSYPVGESTAYKNYHNIRMSMGECPLNIEEVDAIVSGRSSGGNESKGSFKNAKSETSYQAQDGTKTKNVSTDKPFITVSVDVAIDQALSLERQAFRGTMTMKNSHPASLGAIKDVQFNLDIIDPETGEKVTDKEFEIQLEKLSGFSGEESMNGPWNLACGKQGTVSVLMIPTKYAAPTKAKNYKVVGSISYIDPLLSLSNPDESRKEENLIPKTITVNPTPQLVLDYFIPKKIVGDDPMTEDEVEASEPADLSLLIRNEGYGEAKKLKITTKQPEIVDNRDGLLIDFAITGGTVNGKPVELTEDEELVSDFGTLKARSTAYAQWWLTSTLLGRITKYDVSYFHETGYGNENLSLLNAVNAHSLVRSIKKDMSLFGFLTDDEETSEYHFYGADGSVEDVQRVDDIDVTKKNQYSYIVRFEATDSGYVYGYIPDPTDGEGKLKGGNLIDYWRESVKFGNEAPARWMKAPVMHEKTIHFVCRVPKANQAYELTLDLDNPDNISSVVISTEKDEWFTLSGLRVSKPNIKGVYIHHGRKVLVK